MNKYHLLSFVCFIIGVVFFILGFLQGEVETGFFVIFPFILGSGIYAFAGVIFIFISILLFIFSFTKRNESDEIKTNKEGTQPVKKSFKGGGVVLIGPIPIVFGSNWKIAAFLMVLAIILILVAFFAFRLI